MSDNGKARYIPQIKVTGYRNAEDIGVSEPIDYWQDLAGAEPQINTSKAEKELLRVAPEGEFEYRIVRVCKKGRAAAETIRKLIAR